MTTQEKERQNQEYNAYVKQVTPTHSLWANMAKAFLVGGIICCLGQVILNIAGNQGLDKQTAGSWCSMILVLLSVVLTGLNIYPSIAKWGGAGALVPITGFANSVAAPAVEFQKDFRCIIGLKFRGPGEIRNWKLIRYLHRVVCFKCRWRTRTPLLYNERS